MFPRARNVTTQDREEIRTELEFRITEKLKFEAIMASPWVRQIISIYDGRASLEDIHRLIEQLGLEMLEPGEAKALPTKAACPTPWIHEHSPQWVSDDGRQGLLYTAAALCDYCYVYSEPYGLVAWDGQHVIVAVDDSLEPTFDAWAHEGHSSQMSIVATGSRRGASKVLRALLVHNTTFTIRHHGWLGPLVKLSPPGKYMTRWWSGMSDEKGGD